MPALACLALLSALWTTANATELYAPCPACAVPQVVWVHHEGSDNAPPAQMLLIGAGTARTVLSRPSGLVSGCSCCVTRSFIC
jgi:hypothetical protein